MGNESTVTTSNITPSKQEIDEQVSWARAAGFTEIKYFWKDMNRRFVGVSQAFLDYYGFESADKLIGKTDEEMGWHIANNSFKYDEEDVLETGKRIVNVSGSCLIKGVLHEIYTNKRAIHRDGKIIGLFGFFVDAESIEVGGRRQSLVTTDSVTKLCNARGLIESYNYFKEEYNDSHENVFSVGIQVEGYDAYKAAYTDHAADEYLRAVTDVLLKHFQTKAIIGHLQTSKFMMLTRYEDSAQLQDDLEALKADLGKITEVDGNPCTCSPYVFSYEATSTRELEEVIGSFWVSGGRGNILVLKQIISILGDDYDGLIYINLETLEVNRFKHSGIFGSADISNYNDFWKMYSTYVVDHVKPDLSDELFAMGTLKVMKERLAEVKSFEQEYLDDENRYCAIRFAKLEEKGFAPQHVVVSFKIRDEEARARMKLQSELEEARKEIEELKAQLKQQ